MRIPDEIKQNILQRLGYKREKSSANANRELVERWRHRDCRRNTKSSSLLSVWRHIVRHRFVKADRRSRSIRFWLDED